MSKKRRKNPMARLLSLPKFKPKTIKDKRKKLILKALRRETYRGLDIIKDFILDKL